VLRNRKRALVFFESPWDSFGPTYGVDAPSPEEVRACVRVCMCVYGNTLEACSTYTHVCSGITLHQYPLTPPDTPAPRPHGWQLDRDQVFSDNDPAAPVWESPPPYPKR
jgi:hypothetical protein